MKKKIILFGVAIVVVIFAGVYGYYNLIDSRPVTWGKAQSILANCEVSEIIQTSGKKVVFKLKTLKKVWSIQPKRDEAFAEVTKNFPKCGSVFEISEN